MRIFALELNNDIKGIESRKAYIESLIARLPSPEFVVLPELAICSYMASPQIWQYADNHGADTSKWAMEIAQKYHTLIGVGYLDKENDDYYNRYLIAGEEKVHGTVTKSEGESAVFKRGKFDSVIHTPIGNIGVAICYDAKRKHFYDNVKDETLSLILFPHGCPADPKKPAKEQHANDFFCEAYEKAFGIPVIYVNSRGALEYMPGKMGRMMEKAGFTMNGLSKIYDSGQTTMTDNFQDCSDTQIVCDIPEAIGADVEIHPRKRQDDILFHGNDITKGNWFFRQFILKPDTKAGIRAYSDMKNHLQK